MRESFDPNKAIRSAMCPGPTCLLMRMPTQCCCHFSVSLQDFSYSPKHLYFPCKMNVAFEKEIVRILLFIRITLLLKSELKTEPLFLPAAPPAQHRSKTHTTSGHRRTPECLGENPSIIKKLQFLLFFTTSDSLPFFSNLLSTQGRCF